MGALRSMVLSFDSQAAGPYCTFMGAIANSVQRFISDILDINVHHPLLRLRRLNQRKKKPKVIPLQSVLFIKMTGTSIHRTRAFIRCEARHLTAPHGVLLTAPGRGGRGSAERLSRLALIVFTQLQPSPCSLRRAVLCSFRDSRHVSYVILLL